MATRDDARFYWTWKNRLYEEWEVPKGADKAKAMAVADDISRGTGYGLRCFRSNSVIASELGMKRPTVSRYRKMLVKAGWFAETGEHRGGRGTKVAVLRITVPDAKGVGQVDAVEPPTCVVCKSLMNVRKMVRDEEHFACPNGCGGTIAVSETDKWRREHAG